MKNNKRPTQADRILKHLKTHRGITRLTAFEQYGCVNLPARIFELKEDGHRIVSVRKTVTNRFGEKCSVSEYRLVKEI